MPSERILFAITGHGFGHATRSLAIGAQLRARCPHLCITYSTAVPRPFLAKTAGAPLADFHPRASPQEPFTLRSRAYEPGTIERTCFEVERTATCAKYREFLARREALLDEEVDFLRAGGFRAVVSDIAALPIGAATRAGLPSIAVSNFTWDWIIEPVIQGEPDADRILEALRADYEGAETFLRLPFHQTPHPFRSVEELPLVARARSLSREQARTFVGLAEKGNRPLVLVTIGGFQAMNWPAIRVNGCEEFDFLLVGDLPIDLPRSNVVRLPERLPDGICFPDLVGAADVLLAKPGYGTCSECAALGKPMVAIERRGFRESAVLAEGMKRLVPWGTLSLADFFAGAWPSALCEALAAPAAAPAPADGAARAAQRIGEILGL